MNTSDFARLTIRARVAFVEQVARMVLSGLDPMEPGFNAASGALDLVAAWRSGKLISGDALNEQLLNSQDEGVFAYVDANFPKDTDNVYNVVGAAICYTAWHAYRLAGEMLPEGIEQVSEEFVQWLLDEAKKNPLYREAAVKQLLESLLEKYLGQAPNSVGEPVHL